VKRLQSKLTLRLRPMSKPPSTGMSTRSRGLGLNFLKSFVLLIRESLIIRSDIRIFVQEFAAR